MITNKYLVKINWLEHENETVIVDAFNSFHAKQLVNDNKKKGFYDAVSSYAKLHNSGDLR